MSFLGDELSEAREKLARAESSSSESEDDASQPAANKKKKVDSVDKPTEEVTRQIEL